MKTFTILQAVYKNDNPNYLDESFQSILDNTIAPKEIILVKDGSLTEALELVISEWKEKLPLTVVGYEHNKGLAHALNYGLQYIDTDYIARMDSDDICFPQRFEKQLQYIGDNSNVEILGTCLSEFYIEKDGRVYSKERKYPEIVDKSSKYLFKGTPLGHPTVMIKTELLQKYGYSENTNLCEDVDLWFRLIRDGHVIHNLQEPLLNFRITDGTFRRRSISKAFSEFKIYWKNLIALFGFNLLLIYPIARLFVRFLPYKFNKRLYFSILRKKMF